MKGIPLGFAVGTGKPVGIPLRHLAVVGQTQESGKTTTLEALILRAGVRAIERLTITFGMAFTDDKVRGAIKHFCGVACAMYWLSHAT